MFLCFFAHTMYVGAVYCYRLSSMVCRSVTLVSPAKMAEPIQMPYGFRTWLNPGNHVLDKGPHPHGKGQFWGGKRRHIVQYRHTLPSSVKKTAEPIEMSFGLWAQIGTRNHVLDVVPDPIWEAAILGERSPMRRGYFGGKGCPLYRHFLPWAVQKGLNRLAIWVVDSNWPKEAQVQS